MLSMPTLWPRGEPRTCRAEAPENITNSPPPEWQKLCCSVMTNSYHRLSSCPLYGTSLEPSWSQASFKTDAALGPGQAVVYLHHAECLARSVHIEHAQSSMGGRRSAVSEQTAASVHAC